MADTIETFQAARIQALHSLSFGKNKIRCWVDYTIAMSGFMGEVWQHSYVRLLLKGLVTVQQEEYAIQMCVPHPCTKQYLPI